MSALKKFIPISNGSTIGYKMCSVGKKINPQKRIVVRYLHKNSNLTDSVNTKETTNIHKNPEKNPEKRKRDDKCGKSQLSNKKDHFGDINSHNSKIGPKILLENTHTIKGIEKSNIVRKYPMEVNLGGKGCLDIVSKNPAKNVKKNCAEKNVVGCIDRELVDYEKKDSNTMLENHNYENFHHFTEKNQKKITWSLKWQKK